MGKQSSGVTIGIWIGVLLLAICAGGVIIHEYRIYLVGKAMQEAALKWKAELI
ncbi:MAG: hypothetical protein WBF93_11025 [Pirellulales bacterium]